MAVGVLQSRAKLAGRAGPADGTAGGTKPLRSKIKTMARPKAADQSTDSPGKANMTENSLLQQIKAREDFW